MVWLVPDLVDGPNRAFDILRSIGWSVSHAISYDCATAGDSWMTGARLNSPIVLGVLFVLVSLCSRSSSRSVISYPDCAPTLDRRIKCEWLQRHGWPVNLMDAPATTE